MKPRMRDQAGPGQPLQNAVPAQPARRENLWAWCVMAAAVFIISAIRIRHLGIPLERDEGEYAYMGQLMLEGVPPYSIAYNMKMPGIYAAYALIMGLFGQTPAGIHLGLLLVNIASIMVIFLLARKLFDPFTAAIAGTTYGLLSMSSSVYGLHAHATHFIVLPAMGGLLTLLKAKDSVRRSWLLLGGVLFGLALLMKQHAIFFVLFACLCLLSHRRHAGSEPYGQHALRQIVFMSGVALPVALTFALLYLAGVFGSFWFWCVTYARHYVTLLPIRQAAFYFCSAVGIPGLGDGGGSVFSGTPLLWGLALLGLVTVLWDPECRSRRPFVLGLAVFSFLTVCPGFYFRPHYFVTLLPAAALLAGIAMGTAVRRLQRMKRAIPARLLASSVYLLAAGWSLFEQKDTLFAANVNEVIGLEYGTADAFSASPEIGRYIRAHSTPGDRIAIIGSEPQIYFYAHRRSATGYIYMYPLFENHPFAAQMQQEMIREIEAVRPRFLVFVANPTSLGVAPDPRLDMFRWYDNYSRLFYNLVGIVDIQDTRTNYAWGEQARVYRPTSMNVVFVYERRAP
ncbi:MAG: glycosyltransferase family 39 protein [Lentisphaerae bacterium]|nr:glycosyltransferase family 39 protein [Lentisphaerota bacterium]